jgi:hypothetical protein
MTVEELEEFVRGLDWDAAFLNSTPRQLASFRRKREDALYLLDQRPGVGIDGISLPIGVVQGQVIDTIMARVTLLGLLGTVTGMIGSFGIMSQAGIGQPHAVTGGVAEALIATATGLLIAILTLVPYNYFSNRAEREIEEIEYYASRLEMALRGDKEKK